MAHCANKLYMTYNIDLLSSEHFILNIFQYGKYLTRYREK